MVENAGADATKSRGGPGRFIAELDWFWYGWLAVGCSRWCAKARVNRYIADGEFVLALIL